MAKDNIADIAALLRDNTVVLTPNSRLSRSLSKSLDRFFSRDRDAWPSVSVKSLNNGVRDWLLQYQFNGQVSSKPLAQSTEAINLWQSIIRDSDHPIVRPQATAKLAYSAYNVLREWQIDPEQDYFSFAASEDSAAYLEWYRVFCKELPGRPWQIPGDAYGELAACIDLSCTHIVLVGFNDLAPLYNTIMRSAASLVAVDWHCLDSAVQVYASPDRNDELFQMARWAKVIQRDNPDASIAVCIPDLSQRRDTVLHAFDREFQAASLQPGQTRSESCFDVSAGVSLAEVALVESWLQLLAATQQSLAIEIWQRLAQSPFLTLFDQASDYAALAAYPRPHASLAQLVAWVGGSAKRPLDQLWTQSKQLSKSRRLSEWLTEFDALADIVKWPGERSLNSVEFQQRQVLAQQLLGFAQLQLKAARFTFGEALALLNQYLAEKVYHSQAPATGLSVLGALEASGQVFDYLWVSGMEEGAWPAAISPNPLIPVSLQQQYQLPRGSVARELRYAEKMIGDFSCAAKSIVFSYCRRVDDAESDITSLLKCDTAPAYSRTDALAALQASNHTSVADSAVALPKTSTTISATALALQSECQFKSFAHNRLQLRGAASATEGLTPATRGSLLHAAFEALFKVPLAALNDDLQSHIIRAAADAVATLSNKLRRLYEPVLLEVEKRRLQLLLEHWFADIESRREPYDIGALEFAESVDINGLSVTMRLDRIDVLDDASWYIIDYKSSAYRNHKWYDERLPEAQLPLYAVALNARHSISGIAVAHVRPDTVKISDMGRATLANTAIDNAAWQQQLERWKLQIEQLANDYKSGIAGPNPISTQTCNYCEYSSLCRYSQAESEALADD